MNAAKFKLIGAVSIFGTVGIFVHYIPLPSATLAFCRGIIGSAFLLLLLLLTGKKLDLAAIKRNLPLLCLSGAAIGINWILLLEAYHYTTVATATICYYLAPLFLMLASPLLGEKLTVKKCTCIGVALVGMVFVSGVLTGGIGGFTGILLGVCAAVFYGSVMFMNKRLSPIGAYDKTIIQLFTAAIVILPYLLFTGGLSFPPMETISWVFLAVVGIIHTGFAYALYFGSMKDLSAQSIAILCYLDPVLSIILSALVLQENVDIFTVIGAVLILGSALYSELPERKKV